MESRAQLAPTGIRKDREHNSLLQKLAKIASTTRSYRKPWDTHQHQHSSLLQKLAKIASAARSYRKPWDTHQRRHSSLLQREWHSLHIKYSRSRKIRIANHSSPAVKRKITRSATHAGSGEVPKKSSNNPRCNL